jgi:hypothetical protein
MLKARINFPYARIFLVNVRKIPYADDIHTPITSYICVSLGCFF